MKIKLSLTLLYLVALCYMNASAQKATKTQEAPISAQLKKKVIDSLLYKLDEIYVFPDTVVKISATIRSYQKNGAYSKITDPIVFADTLTSQLRRLTNDKHLGISYEKQNNFSDNTDKINETEKTKNFQRFLIEHN